MTPVCVVQTYRDFDGVLSCSIFKKLNVGNILLLVWRKCMNVSLVVFADCFVAIKISQAGPVKPR